MISDNIEKEKENNTLNSLSTSNKCFVLDTSYFIRLQPLNLAEGCKYYTTDLIIKEIKDEKAREFYNLNKEFIEIKNPSRETMRISMISYSILIII
jgi:rRNA maturation endonuclease Nob1